MRDDKIKLQDFEHEVPHAVNATGSQIQNFGLGRQERDIQYTLQSNESKLDINEEPMRKVSGTTARFGIASYFR